MIKGDASILLEEVIDTLIEVGNGVSEKELNEACDKLLIFREKWFVNSDQSHKLDGAVQINHPTIVRYRCRREGE